MSRIETRLLDDELARHVTTWFDYPPVGTMTTQAEVRLATIDLSFHRAASGVVRSILARHGVSVV
ncbi:hypothetical protein WK95_16125 [Burkholderia ubonensis]|nr:hypothetical protein WK95_16125 [Burkholderia ubonensis]